MATTNITITLTADQLFAAAQGQVEPHLHGVLRVEIARRWADGLRVPVHLVVSDQSTD